MLVHAGSCSSLLQLGGRPNGCVNSWFMGQLMPLTYWVWGLTDPHGLAMIKHVQFHSLFSVSFVDNQWLPTGYQLLEDGYLQVEEKLNDWGMVNKAGFLPT